MIVQVRLQVMYIKCLHLDTHQVLNLNVNEYSQQLQIEDYVSMHKIGGIKVNLVKYINQFKKSESE